MRKYIIMGVQGSGKGTQAKLLAERLELEHISVGDIFRRLSVDESTGPTRLSALPAV